MSTFFNYERAWKEYIKPEFDKLYPHIQKAYDLTKSMIDTLFQVGASHDLSGQTKELTDAFDAIPIEHLIRASSIVYNYGHCAPDGTATEGGLYWKFQILADQSIIRRMGKGATEPPIAGGIKEQWHQSKIEIDTLDTFHDHEPGTEYDNEELPGYLKSLSPDIGDGILEIMRVDSVNHKPDVFCIGPKHFPKDGSMFIKPEQAPCCNCHEPYSAHTSERAMFVKTLIEDKNKLGEALKKVLDICTKNGIKIDGFALVK